ncbi:hypothetical protein DPMN_063336 [Dreissena polymorpha]|uniref:Uncharacterized protein n=1 Tax=Dreissena polymorpha TaxID=45954 RepID=A0A9D4HJ01_DREPO|nr:hypothetical protein DPMN_063336 [Dreissena polymorpha]
MNRTPVSRVTGGDTHHYTIWLPDDETTKPGWRFFPPPRAGHVRTTDGAVSVKDPPEAHRGLGPLAGAMGCFVKCLRVDKFFFLC